jgi:hypothetical protein
MKKTSPNAMDNDIKNTRPFGWKMPVTLSRTDSVFLRLFYPSDFYNVGINSWINAGVKAC